MAQEKLSIEVGVSVSQYFAEINRIMQNTIDDIASAVDNCGSWREGESPY